MYLDKSLLKQKNSFSGYQSYLEQISDVPPASQSGNAGTETGSYPVASHNRILSHWES